MEIETITLVDIYSDNERKESKYMYLEIVSDSVTVNVDSKTEILHSSDMGGWLQDVACTRHS